MYMRILLYGSTHGTSLLPVVRMLHRQGEDVGPQYRSAIFATSEAQLAAVQQVLYRQPGILMSKWLPKAASLDLLLQLCARNTACS